MSPTDTEPRQPSRRQVVAVNVAAFAVTALLTAAAGVAIDAVGDKVRNRLKKTDEPTETTE